MDIDVWFSRYEGDLFFNATRAGEAPEVPPRRVNSMASAMHIARKTGHRIVQVGILPAEMIGLDVEV